MNELRQSAILLSLIDHMRDQGSWCGETHVQKSAYFLQELMHVPLEFEFIIYKYGPYSFDLKDALISMRADSLIGLIPSSPYGSTLVPGELSEQVKKRFPKTLRQFEPQIQFVANSLSEKKVSELEAISTALFIQLNQKGIEEEEEEVIKQLQVLKPHIKDDLARNAVNELRGLIQESKGYKNHSTAVALTL